MLEGIAPRLAAYADHNGHTLYSVMWYSSTSKIWGSSDKLRNYISRLNPSFIIVCLGANELTVRDIASARRQYVEKIIEDIDTIPYLWIGPPNWRRDTGINALISSVANEGSFIPRSTGFWLYVLSRLLVLLILLEHQFDQLRLFQSAYALHAA